MPTDPADNLRPLPGDGESRAGYALSDVVQARIYLTDFEEEREP
jgi:hypothetical protein